MVTNSRIVGVVTNFHRSVFPFKLQVLWRSGDYSTRENAAILADPGPFHDSNIAANPGAFPDLHVVVNYGKRVDLYVCGQFGIRDEYTYADGSCLIIGCSWRLMIAADC
jgi:hypothetical protein